MHLNRSKEKIQLIAREDTQLYSLDYTEESGHDHHQLVATKLLQHTDWLDCFEEFPLYLWNPSTSDYKQVPQLPIFPNHPNYVAVYGFGYNPKVNDYKIIRIEGSVYLDSAVWVYSLFHDSWRKLPNIPYGIHDYKTGELVNGCLHWLALSKEIGYCCYPLVIAFDIGDETFGEVPLPDISADRKCKFHVTVFEMQLCMVYTDACGNTNVWVMKEYRVKESWTMLFSIHEPGVTICNKSNLNPLCVTKNGSVLLKVTGHGKDVFSYDPNGSVLLKVTGHGKDVFSYDPKTTSRSILPIKGIYGVTEVRTYTESTVGVSTNNWHYLGV
ncbi:hypothetical protein AQUCO_08300106v1 [Aquilegia coerulea]|uniref:F-box associated beta-propeller type 1 domain-containing protein n=1 Tax=Aquilegia coerulea TaxID=218851 RepID=A0A2G5C7A0_AQUCA|nr:hypothetical protein AQUCO_08300106v1 [Aquilegia coerulea]